MAKKTNTFRDSVPPLRKGSRRATYYLTDALIKRLKIRAIEDGADASAVVRAALEQYLGSGTKGVR